jgi:hypothetical protein
MFIGITSRTHLAPAGNSESYLFSPFSRAFYNTADNLSLLIEAEAAGQILISGRRKYQKKCLAQGLLLQQMSQVQKRLKHHFEKNTQLQQWVLN